MQDNNKYTIFFITKEFEKFAIDYKKLNHYTYIFISENNNYKNKKNNNFININFNKKNLNTYEICDNLINFLNSNNIYHQTIKDIYISNDYANIMIIESLRLLNNKIFMIFNKKYLFHNFKALIYIFYFSRIKIALFIFYKILINYFVKKKILFTIKINI